ncbi:DUF2231 domain-containing protein [Catenuloplanes japonicus]|uniref:DUF2231 domain-containing protein n=1 Tax=Catenuloplanes japonicus TaxID=33876 RepID=UPI000523FA1B|nr:DUF2231 domain-containing protein [Catenuloplanes japonicus]
MFETVMGIPAHPLMVHAAVVFVPLLAVLAIVYAFVPFTRAHTRWVLGLLAIGAPVSALLAKLTGDAFYARLDTQGRISEGYYARLNQHSDLGTTTLWASIALGVITLALVWFVRPKDGFQASNRLLGILMGVLALGAAGATLYYVIRTGDTGAKAVWEGQ